MAGLNQRLEGVTVTEAVLSFLPVVAWLILYGVLISIIPHPLRPGVNVSTLPKLESYLFFPHRWFNRDPNIFLDIFAAIPYTLHPLLPLFNLARVIARSNVKRGLVFARCFGTMNFLGVLTQLLLPMAPPWYFEKYGTSPADYSMAGDPALLKRVDLLTGHPHYQSIYGTKANQVVFGTFPSLHAAWPYMLASFEPLIGWPMWAYTLWVWWAALYLQHHYFIDLLGAALYVEVVLYFLGEQPITARWIRRKSVNRSDELEIENGIVH